VLTDVKIAGRGGALLDCFDLFIGQRIDELGKPTTLLQGAARAAVLPRHLSDSPFAPQPTMKLLNGWIIMQASRFRL
jgi:hypothetical protein